MLVHELLRHSAARTPDAVALIESGRTTTYGELDALANRFARVLQDREVRRGDRVVIALENGAQCVAAYLGAMRAGAAAVPLPADSRNDRFAKAIADCRPSACVVEAAIAADDRCSAAMADVPSVLFRSGTGRRTPADPAGIDLTKALASASDQTPNCRSIDLDLAAIIYTSGSTGDPRGVMLTHRNVEANTRSIVSYLGLTSVDRVMCVLPFHYVYGLSLLHTHLLVGGSVVVENRFAYPSVVLEAMAEHRVTGFAGVPSTFAVLLSRPELAVLDLPHLRYVTQAGGPMSPAKIAEWRQRVPGAAFFVMYGATEASARLTYLDPSDVVRKAGSIGRPIPNVEVAVLREDGSPADVAEVGELTARGSNISCGYWNDSEETRARFGPRGYRTGDLGYVDEEGCLFLVGRRHEMIKSGAHRVGPKEIEDVLHRHPAVQEAAVVGAAHPILGEVPIGFATLRPGSATTANELRAFCAAHLPAYKVPSEVHVRPELPKIPGVGKIDKRALRDETGSEGRPTPTAMQAATRE
jgi:long-chain acyl-CoA synthetase